ncbi:MAG: 23S rRNA pseudouridine(955/2504/2580) synthase RluC [Gammaproteobacteria bacterium]|nr:23S rRNA pseudouridine(955/2504/2580) synthase RluC [Gammaproteobacteria bacterium]MBU2222927.1 23S rRNA pseudouridine(955/2504/2580) synthase RluC [Gammaproteobacteria bacterium]MBU2278706.1 23S rRNA pseudouridine(955/2504/2580) synthase RluC [Gammaproteobacteria bacterium]
MTEEIKTPIQYIDVDEEYAGQRLDNFLLARLKGVPKSVIYRVIRKGEVRVNKGRIKPEYKLQVGDQVRVPPLVVAAEKDQVSTKLSLVKNLESHILFEDNDLIVLNKPTGMAVHGGSGLQFGVIEALRALRPTAKFLELVHRLDRDTSGCLLIAKKRSVLTHIHEQLRLKTVEKKYWALVAGQWDARNKKVTEPLKKNTLQSGERVVRVDERDGKPSETRFKILQRYAEGTLVEAFPVTGRTHQIRVHTACVGHPIACDDKYGDNDFTGQMNALGLKRLYLHAKTLAFTHPNNGLVMKCEAPLDSELEKILTKLNRK